MEGKVREGSAASWATSEFKFQPHIPHWCSSMFDCRNACGLADRIDIVEVGDRDFRLVDGAVAIFLNPPF